MLALDEFQALNMEIYLVPNDRDFSNARMFSRLHHHITQILKAVRKEKYENIEYHLCMSFSWVVALLNRFHIDLATEMWKFFPGICPYCKTAPCSCKKERAKERQDVDEKTNGKPPTFLSDWQTMFAKIYPNVVMVSAIHLAEEAGEVDEAIENYSATHDHLWFDKVAEELVDVVTNIFGVANCLKLDLADGLAGYFSQGCPKCHGVPCTCGGVVVDRPIPLCKKAG